MPKFVVLGSIALIVFLFATSAAVSAAALINTSNTGSSFDVVWYGPSNQSSESTENDAVIHLQNSGVNVEKRSRPLADLSDGKVVVINAQFSSVFSATEVDLLKSYVNNGGKLILTADTDYAFCNPPSTCAMEVSRNFGFGFDEDIQTGTIIPATGQSGHPIWTTPHPLASFSNWCC